MTLPRVLYPAVVVAVISGCDSSTAPDNGGHAAPVSLGDTVAAAISQAETDSYSFTSATDGYIVIFLEALDSNVVELRIDNPAAAGTESIVRASYAGNASLNANRTPVRQVSAGIKYRIRVNAPAGIIGKYVNGPYRFHIHPIDRNPEDGPATLALGPQVVESFAGSGDFDHWTFTTSFADTVGLLFRFALQSPAANTQIRVNLIGHSQLNPPAGYVDFISPGDTSTSTSSLITPSDLSTFELNVSLSDPGSYSYLEPVLPAYSFSSTFVDLRPEQRPVMGGLLDTLLTEPIDSVGDVDTYRIMPETTSGGYFLAFMADQASPGDTIEVRMLHAANDVGQPILRSTGADTALLDHIWGPFYQDLPTIPFTVTVRALHLGQPSNQPTYRFGILLQDTLPETASATLAIGDTITGEQIEYPGDVDAYTFSGTVGQVVTADLELISFGGIGRLDITGLGTVLPNPGAPLGPTPLTVILPSTGTFQVRVFAYTPGRGSYRLILK